MTGMAVCLIIEYFRAAKAQTLQLENEFFAGDNKDCVKIDKDGNGLNRLWNQMLRMFPLASLETAEAITSLYPTMHSLMEVCDFTYFFAVETTLVNCRHTKTATPLRMEKNFCRIFQFEEPQVP